MTKIKLRKAWFQVHKWIGLILAVLIIPLSLTGSALVWDDAVDVLIHPARHQVTAPPALPPATYAAKARALLGPDQAISAITLPRDGTPVAVQAVSLAETRGRPVRTTLYLNPVNASLVDRARSDGGILRVFHMVHGSLMIPGVGRQIVGWIGVAMFVSAISGIWLWWPTVGSWLRGFRWRRHSHFDVNLHHLTGFWIALPLGLLALTGAWISFPGFFGQFEAKQPRAERSSGPSRRELLQAKPLATPQIALDQALASAKRIAPGQPRDIRWPTDVQPQWRIVAGHATALVDDQSGTASVAPPAERRARTGLSGAMRSLHDGRGMPFIWQLIIFIGGIIPAILAVTGIIMWWRARKWKRELMAHRRERGLA